MSELRTHLTESGLGLVLVPGISSGAELFDKVEHSVDALVVRVEAWSGAEDLEEPSLDELHELLGEAVRLLRDGGCESIGVIGKSFGGQVALTSRVDVDPMFRVYFDLVAA